MINTLQTPRYYSILAGFDVNGDGFPFSDRTGTVGRNSYRRASYYGSDIRLQRVFQIGEHLNAEASMEAFNLFNHMNVLNIDQVLRRGRLSRSRSPPVWRRHRKPREPDIRQPNFTGSARQLQASVRLNF